MLTGHIASLLGAQHQRLGFKLPGRQITPEVTRRVGEKDLQAIRSVTVKRDFNLLKTQLEAQLQHGPPSRPATSRRRRISESALTGCLLSNQNSALCNSTRPASDFTGHDLNCDDQKATFDPVKGNYDKQVQHRKTTRKSSSLCSQNLLAHTHLPLLGAYPKQGYSFSNNCNQSKCDEDDYYYLALNF